MSAIDSSLDRINAAVVKRLSGLGKTMTTEELADAHAFIKEAKELQDTLWAYDAPQGVCNPEVGGEEDLDETLTEMYVQGCYLIKYLWQMVDEDKLKEIDGRWILDQTQDYIQASRELFGTRVPELPAMRPLSKPKSTKKVMKAKIKIKKT